MQIACFLLRIHLYLSLLTDFGSLEIYNFMTIRAVWTELL